MGAASTGRVALVGFEDQDNLGLRYLSSTLHRRGHDTRIVQLGSSTSEVARQIYAYRPDIVGFSLIASWVVAVVFTPYLGVKLLPELKPVEGGHAGIYDTPRYRRLRRLVAWCVRRKYAVAGVVVAMFLLAGGGMAVVKKQFFPNSDRPELLVEVQLPLGTSIETTSAAAHKVEAWLSAQPEAEIVTSYIGAGAPRFFFSYNPELPDPSFAKIVVLTPSAQARDVLKVRLRQAAADGRAARLAERGGGRLGRTLRSAQATARRRATPLAQLARGSPPRARPRRAGPAVESCHPAADPAIRRESGVGRRSLRASRPSQKSVPLTILLSAR